MIKRQRQVVRHVLGRTAIIQRGEGGDIPGQKIKGVNVCLTKPQRVQFTSESRNKTNRIFFSEHIPAPQTDVSLSEFFVLQAPLERYNSAIVLVIAGSSLFWRERLRRVSGVQKYIVAMWRACPTPCMTRHYFLRSFYIFFLFPLTLEFTKQFTLTYNLSLCNYFS